jgi:phage terminase small subunit
MAKQQGTRAKIPAKINIDKFVAHYIKDCNGLRAYRAARPGATRLKDSTCQTEASKLLKKPIVQEKLDDARAAHLKEIGVETTQVLTEVRNMAMFDPKEVLDWDGKVLTVKSLEDVPIEARRMIAEINQDRFGGLKIKFHNKQAALRDLAQHLGCFPNKVEHSGPDGKDIPVNLEVNFK